MEGFLRYSINLAYCSHALVVKASRLEGSGKKQLSQASYPPPEIWTEHTAGIGDLELERAYGRGVIFGLKPLLPKDILCSVCLCAHYSTCTQGRFMILRPFPCGR